MDKIRCWSLVVTLSCMFSTSWTHRDTQEHACSKQRVVLIGCGNYITCFARDSKFLLSSASRAASVDFCHHVNVYCQNVLNVKNDEFWIVQYSTVGRNWDWITPSLCRSYSSRRLGKGASLLILIDRKTGVSKFESKTTTLLYSQVHLVSAGGFSLKFTYPKGILHAQAAC